MKNKISDKILIFISILSLAIGFVIIAKALPKIEDSTPCSLNLEYKHENEPIKNASFKIYRVADFTEDADFSLRGDFKDYKVKINDLDTQGYAIAANTLATYVLVHNIEPVLIGKTNNAGTLKFENLKPGLYLLLCDGVTVDTNQYKLIPSLISLPSLGNNGFWVYDFAINPKYEVMPLSDGEDPVYKSLRVIKVWNDYSDHYKKRPKAVEIQLFADGELIDTVELHEENSWTHTWQNLESNRNWRVIEPNVPQDYNVAYTSDNSIFKVQNTYEEDKQDPPPEPTSDGNSGDGGGTIPDGPPTSTTYTNPPGSIDPKLPQTGQLWWPIPLSAGFGLVFFAFGWFIVFRKHKDEEDEEKE